MTLTLPIAKYRTFVFDCDGVVLNSNRVKTEAFYQATLPYGKKAAKAMVEHHVTNGGISRYIKFAHFLDQLVPQHAFSVEGPDLNELLQAYAKTVRQGLLQCEVAPGLEALRQQTPEARWLIVSGSDQAELRDVFSIRDIARWFDGGIFGSPDTKDTILDRETENSTITWPALFLGDSTYDYEAASRAGLDFVFFSAWSDVKKWEHWVKNRNISYRHSVKSLN